MAKLHITKNDLPEELRVQIIEILNARLADAIDLQSQTKQAHWNVKGSSFIALHELFDTISGEVTTYVDDIAERVVQLGGTAYGTSRTAASNSSLDEYPLDIYEGSEHVAALSTVMASFGKKIRENIDQASDLQDATTADLFTGISRGIDKSLWFVEAHNQQ
jgi:starvation-inducible DNA-binding protein